MIIDARDLPDKTLLETDVCIIGGGPAGISLARALDGQSFRVILLEGGGMAFEAACQALYKGENVGLSYEDLDQTRSRYLGGSSNCWGGFCRPMDAHDFEARDWVPNSGWPIGRDDLLPYYRRTQSILQLGPFEYDPKLWEEWLGRPDARLVPFDRARALNIIAQLSPPTKFGQVYGDELARSGNVTTYLNANVTEIETPGNGARVTGVEVRTLAGAAIRVAARTYILAAGGIDTPRLLLASNRHQAAGVGNQNDLVGRYFMDHPRLRCSEIIFNDPKANSAIYDLHVIFAGKMVARGTKMCGYFGLTEETQRSERLGNTRCYVASRFLGDDPYTYGTIKLLYQAVQRSGSLAGRYGELVSRVVRELPKVAVLAVGLRYMPRVLRRGFTLETVVEPTPLPDSRVTLGSDRDALGVPRARVDWRAGELEKRTIRRTQEIVGAEMERVGAGKIVVEAPREGEPWPDTLNGCWHHMGTARMHADPRHGVVDADCRVHGMENLFIAGSSVFPTCGSDMPTITIVALALRLADHIKASFSRPVVESAGADLAEPTMRPVSSS